MQNWTTQPAEHVVQPTARALVALLHKVAPAYCRDDQALLAEDADAFLSSPLRYAVLHGEVLGGRDAPRQFPPLDPATQQVRYLLIQRHGRFVIKVHMVILENPHVNT
jgi:hypothetical protein